MCSTRGIFYEEKGLIVVLVLLVIGAIFYFDSNDSKIPYSITEDNVKSI
jgi:hypothetical protein